MDKDKLVTWDSEQEQEEHEDIFQGRKENH